MNSPLDNNSQVAYLNFWTGTFLPRSGGHLRAHNIFEQLQQRAKTTFFSGRIVKRYPNHWQRVKFLPRKTSWFVKVLCKTYSLFNGHSSSSDLELALEWCFKTRFFKNFTHIIFTSIEQTPVAAIIKVFNPSVTTIFDAHNVESEMRFERQIQWTIRLEMKLASMVDFVFCCSDRDKEQLYEICGHPQILVIPNGASLQESRPQVTKMATDSTKSYPILWIGSLQYFPNVEGLNWLIDFVIPQLPFTFHFAGSGQPSAELKASLSSHNQIRFLGFVENLEEFYSRGNIVVIPILSGSGTRLKVLEAMAHSKCVITTAKGCEGINCTSGYDIIVANSASEFISAISKYSFDNSAALEIGTNALQLIESAYSWHVIGDKLFNEIQE